MRDNLRVVIDEAPMHRGQMLAVLLAFGLTALDGFDIASISFAAPGISAEWGIERGALGVVLAMELIGMCFGSIIMGGIADRHGRRPTILTCLGIMTSGMALTMTADSMIELSFWRVLTGIGIGGMLASTNALVAEFSNNQRRHFLLSLMLIGYPVGIVIGGTLIRPLLAGYDWRFIFLTGAVVTALFIPAVWFWLPESMQWLARRQPRGALASINKTLSKFSKPPLDRLPDVPSNDSLPALRLFSGPLMVTTLLVTAAYFCHMTTFYFIIKWAPQVVADLGFSPASAGDVLTWSNVGGAAGGLLFGALALRTGLKKLTIAVLLLSVGGVTAFGSSPSELSFLCALAAVAGFATNAGVVGIYTIIAYVFPTELRAFGTGFVIGVGRGGAALSPIIAGFLFEFGLSLAGVALALALGSLLAAVAVFLLAETGPDLAV